MKNMKIATKLITAFLAISMISALIGVVGIIGLRQMMNVEANMYKNEIVPFPYISNMIEDVCVLREQVRTAMLYYDDTIKITEIEQSIEEYESDFLKNMELYSPSIVNPASRKLYDESNQLFKDKFMPTVEKSVQLAKAGQVEEAKAALDKTKDETQTLLQNLDQCMENRVNRAKNDYLASSNTGEFLNFIQIIVMLIGILISVLWGILLSRAISKPINEMADAAEMLSKGELDVNIAYKSKDEIGSLARSLSSAANTLKAYIADISQNIQLIARGDLTGEITQDYIGDFAPIKDALTTVSSQLNQTLSIINLSAEQVGSGAEQVSLGAQALSQGATEQASSIEELSASISEVSEKIRQNAESVKLASEHVEQAGSGVQYSNQQMQSMLSAMNDINNSSAEIGKIIKTIDDIAFQTNILALNAAVEAARAGAAGKGFAVVADEVRNLSGKSAEAAKQTTILIQNSIQSVKAGSKIADETARALADVSIKAQSVTDSIERIKQASSEQATTISQIVMGIEQISTVVQTNSATAEESAAASEELSGQASTLQDELTKFSLKNDSSQKGTHKGTLVAESKHAAAAAKY